MQSDRQEPPSTLIAPCILLDADQAVLEANAAAVDLLEANSRWLSLRHRRLQVAHEPERLFKALTLAKGRGCGAVAIDRPGRLPFTLAVNYEGGCSTPGQTRWHWRIRLRDPEAETPDTELLSSMFGLTPSEAMVAAALATGQATRDIAIAQRVQHNTVLAHVKKALSKTGTSRQAQLVSLVLRSAAMVDAPASLGAGVLSVASDLKRDLPPGSRGSRPISTSVLPIQAMTALGPPRTLGPALTGSSLSSQPFIRGIGT